jgi:predicted secreted hydrolase
MFPPPTRMDRRRFLALPLLLGANASHAAVAYPAVDPAIALEFPRDHGSHPRFRTEWWYITGWVQDEPGRDIGVQVTFFRSRPGVNETSTSAFAPAQLLFAHAALADPQHGRLRHDQRATRTGFGLASAGEGTTDVAIGDWSLRLVANRYEARIVARDFTLDLAFTARSPILLQGTRGVSRKGPRAEQASYYYSRPQLALTGTITVGTRKREVRGIAWLDHEWSSTYLAPEAVGWDWTGINFDDGRALMAFRIRAKDGTDYWRGGTLRDANGRDHALDPDGIRFTPMRQWRSPHTGIQYPVAFRLEAGGEDLRLDPLLDDQELDSRASVGTVYWEGAVRVREASRSVGRGYLELTGYGAPLRI